MTMSENKEGEQSSQKNLTHEKENDSSLPLYSTRRVLSFLGALPCSKEYPYWPSLDRRKSNVFYSVAVLTTMTGMVLFVAVQKKIQYDEIDPSDVFLRTTVFENTLMMIPQAIIYAVWADVSEFNHFMELMSTLQVNYRRLTGEPLKNRRLKFEKISCYSFAVVLVAFYYLMGYFVRGVDKLPHVCMATMYGNIVGSYVVLFWNIASMAIVDAHEDVEAEFIKCLQENKVTANTVYEFRRLWLLLRSMCDSMGKWESFSLGYSVCLGLSVVTLYQGLILLNAGEIRAALGHLVVGSLYSCLVFISCRASHEVQVKMKCLVEKVLPNISLSSCDKKTQKEVLMVYLVENARPAVVTFGETLVVNRNLILSFFSTISTYIIVMMQFIQKSNEL